ncbi:MAG: GFA family protein [Alphaproteobacteria bacterium]
MPKAPLSGGCQCGATRYEITADPVRLYVCHCRECQKQSASAFGISLIVPRAGFRLVQGATKSWTRATDSGRRLTCVFCPECGSRLWHESEPAEATISVKGGSLDRPLDLSAVPHLWTMRMLAGVVIPEGSARHEKEPS